MIHRRLPATFVAAAVVLVAPTVHADPEFDALASAELGDELGGRPIALAPTDDGQVVVVGNDGAHGTLVRLDAAGTPLDPPLQVSQSLHDVAVDDRTDVIAVVGDAAVQVFEPDLSLGWSVDLGAPAAHDPRRRVDIGEAGTIAVASGSTLRTFTLDGRSYGTVRLDQASFAAVAVLETAGRGDALVLATGWMRTAAGDRATLWAVEPDGTASWQATAATPSRGVDLAIGPDGFVYALAEAFEAGPLFDAGTRDIAFDPYTTIAEIASQHVAYYGRWHLDGTLDRGQFFGFADETSHVRPRAIEVDGFGRVHLGGLTTHRLDPTDRGDAALSPETLAHESGFLLTVSSDLERREGWRALEVDGPSDATALSLAAGELRVLLDAAERSAVIAVPIDPAGKEGRRPDRDDVGTFGYESGVSGADPTCYCGPTHRPAPLWVLVLGLLGLARRRRPRR